MAQITLSDLTFGYDGSPELVFDQLCLTLDTSWRLGLVGRNGRGKTTLLRLLLGELSGRGRITMPVQADYFPFPVERRERETAALLAELAPEAEAWQLERELSLLGMGEETLKRSFATLSGGEQTRALLAALFLRPGRYLLIDEPTNHLDQEGRARLSAYLRRKQGFLLVSHDRAFLDGCVDHILALNKRDIQLQRGNFTDWYREKERRDQAERADNQRLKRDIARLEESARRTAGWSDRLEATKYGSSNSGLRPDRGFIGHRSAKLMKRAKAAADRRQAAVEEKRDLLKNIEIAEALKITPAVHPKTRLLEARRVAADYGGTRHCQPVSFTVDQGERVALTGRNGAGKSSLLRLAAGEAIPHTGRLVLTAGTVVSIVPQETGFLSGDLRTAAREWGVELTELMTVLRKLDFDRTLFDADMSTYSAGQKKKVLLARSICQRAHLYLWDEPLNYVDIFSRMQLERLIAEARPTMLLVEHDGAFLRAIGARMVRLDSPQEGQPDAIR